MEFNLLQQKQSSRFRILWACIVRLGLILFYLLFGLHLFDANQGAGHVDHTRGNGAEVAQNPLSLPSGPITRLRAKRFSEALNGLIQEN
jgi:hypothetical protein